MTDAWSPQTNGVVTTWLSVVEELQAQGIKTAPMPSYPEIRLALNPWKMREQLLDSRYSAIHIPTEGPLGLYARIFLKSRKINFSTSSHTKFPEYINERIKLPLSIGYRFLRWFHAPAHKTLCRTPAHQADLEAWQLENLEVWAGGVDLKKFAPQPLQTRCKPRLLYVGRVAVEKNIEAFLEIDIDATKVIVGDGPARADLERAYPQAQWLGLKKGQPLVDEYAQADVFVFPSRTDTFGLVMLEANACGTPVAAFPVTGPIDVVKEGVTGALHQDLHQAIEAALQLPRLPCRAYAQAFGWPAAATALRSQIGI